jgi:di/tricarboxylate transporter
MVSGPAGYTTGKLLRVGLPLILAYIVTTVLAVNLLF